MFFSQNDYEIRCEWGLEGVRLLAPDCDAIVIVDVISFCTAVDVAVSRGALVYPYAWKDERSLAYARTVGAVVAAASRRDPTGFSLAPTSLLRIRPGQSVVLPSPNGSTLSLATGSAPTFAGCLRNASAVSAAAQQFGPRIVVIPAGERWPDGSLRPSLEDQLGAGAVIHALPGRRSPEAQAAEAVFLSMQNRLPEVLLACGSGREAAERGSPEDILLAAAWNESKTAPRLEGGAYRAVS